MPAGNQSGALKLSRDTATKMKAQRRQKDE